MEPSASGELNSAFPTLEYSYAQSQSNGKIKGGKKKDRVILKVPKDMARRSELTRQNRVSSQSIGFKMGQEADAAASAVLSAASIFGNEEADKKWNEVHDLLQDDKKGKSNPKVFEKALLELETLMPKDVDTDRSKEGSNFKSLLMKDLHKYVGKLPC